MRTQEQLQRHGIGMTSQRTRERLIERLYEEGLSNPRVLEVIRRTPRHVFVDEALAHLDFLKKLPDPPVPFFAAHAEAPAAKVTKKKSNVTPLRRKAG